MTERKATKTSWKTVPMSSLRKRLDCELSVSASDFARLSLGSIPGQMEDKWFAYVEDGVLHLHRSWTGYCIFEVTFSCRDETWHSNEIWVNQDPDNYGATDPMECHDLLMGVLSHVLGVDAQSSCHGNTAPGWAE